MGPTSFPAFFLRARRARWAHVSVALLRLFLGFAFVPAGLKKVLAQPFTDAHLHGPFHDFLHAFYATGWFYRFVGALQLGAALLLMTQRFAHLGALVALPILTAIVALCWSTAVYPTAVVATSMWFGLCALLLWDVPRLRGHAYDAQTRPPRFDEHLWAKCGVAVVALYLAVCLATGSVYRPRGADWRSPAFYVFPCMLALVVATGVIDRRRRRGPPLG